MGEQDTVELPLLGFRTHAAELLFVAAQAPGVVADLFWAQAAVAVQHLEGHVGVDLQVQAWTLQLLQTDNTHTKKRESWLFTAQACCRHKVRTLANWLTGYHAGLVAMLDFIEDMNWGKNKMFSQI